MREVLHTFLNSHKIKKPSSRIKHNYHKEKIIGKLDKGMRLRKKKVMNQVSYIYYLLRIEPKKVKDALKDEILINSIYEELNRFTRNDACELFPRLNNHKYNWNQVHIEE